jgi:acyl-CoA thioesterase YciA
MELISTKICKTSDIGVNDNLFGGTMLSWLDEAGGTMAALICCTPNMITLKVDEVLFKEPVKVKDNVRIYGKVVRIGTTSISLQLEARRFNFVKHREELVVSTKATYVKVDENGKSLPIDPDIRNKFNHS